MSHYLLREFAQLNLTTIPTEALVAISDATTAEILKRSGVKKAEQLAHRALKKSVTGRSRPRHESHLWHRGWDDLFPDEGGERKFYVYAHVRPCSETIKVESTRGGKKLKIPRGVFYIGKGTGNRAHDLSRNEGHGVQLRQLLSEGYTKKDIVHILADDLTSSEAFKLEAKLIYLLGTKFEAELDGGGALVNLDLPKRPAGAAALPAREYLATLMRQEARMEARGMLDMSPEVEIPESWGCGAPLPEINEEEFARED